MKAVIYACVDDYNASESYISAQVQVCQTYAEQHGAVVLGVYVDRLTDGSRPGFQQMLQDSNRHLFDSVIVFKLDRFAVTRSAHSRFKEILKSNAVSVLSATEYIPDAPEGVLIESMLEGMAEYVNVIRSQSEEKASLADSVADIAEVIPGFGAVSSAIRAAQGVRDVAGVVGVSPIKAQGFPQMQQGQAVPQQVSSAVPQQARPQIRRNPKPKKDMENFFGKHIAAILAGILIIAATVTSIFMAWNSVSPAARFFMLAIFGVVMLCIVLIKHPKLPEFLAYAVIKNLFVSAGLVVIFITFLLGHSVLGLYPLAFAAALLAVWGFSALFIFRKFSIQSASVVGAVGMSVGCWVTAMSASTPAFSLFAVILGAVYIVTALFEHRRLNDKPLAMYVLLSIASVAVITSALPVISSGAGLDAALLAVISVGTVLCLSYAARSLRLASNIVYVVSLSAQAVVFLFYYGDSLASLSFALCVVVSAVVAAILMPSVIPAAFTSLLFAYTDYAGSMFGGYTFAVLGLVCIMAYVTTRRGDDISLVLRKWTCFTALCVSLAFAFAFTIIGQNVFAGALIMLAAIVLNRGIVDYCPDPPYGQFVHIGSVIVGVLACYVISPEIQGLGEFTFIVMSSILLTVYLKFGYTAAVDIPLYRNLLLPVCSAVAVAQGGMVFSADLPAIAFIPVLIYVGMLFYRFIVDSRSVKNAVSALWIIASLVFLWLNFLIPEGLDVVPSVLMIAVGFGVISFGFTRRRNAERISGLIMVILCTVKAVSFDVWFAVPPVRVVALFVGAGICIAVSRLYAKQSEMLRERIESLVSSDECV